MDTPSQRADEDAAPVAQSERIVLWDVLRGVAVLGVLLANMPWMSFARMISMDGQDWFGHDPTALDHAAFWFVRVFADTKFITIFSMLFGAGLGLAAVKAEERGASSLGFQMRRLAILLVFAIIHGCLIWFGDILGHYAMVGFVAVFFRNLPAHVLGAIGLALIAFGFAVYFVTAPAFMGPMTPPAVVEHQMREAAELYSSGDFVEMAKHRAPFYLVALCFTLPFWGARTLGLFLIGMALVRSGILRDPAAHRATYARMLRFGLPFGIAMQALWVMSSGHYGDTHAILLTAVGSYAAALGLSPAYLAAVYYWCESGFLVGMRRRMAAVGQMAFTSYISHSVITAIIFNYCGQFDRWGRFEGLLLTFAIFAFQLWSSPLWLARFRFGPLEWLWRSVTYFRFQPMTRGAA